MDDEYFRLVVCMRHDTAEHPAVQRILPSIYRSLQKPTKMGFQQALFRSMRNQDFYSDGGIYLGTAPSYQVDLGRLDRVAARITRGFYFVESGVRVPPDHQVKVHSVSGLDRVAPEQRARFVDICDGVMNNPPRVFGENVFAYWFQQARDQPTASAWVFAFFERMFFICFVGPMNSRRAS